MAPMKPALRRTNVTDSDPAVLDEFLRAERFVDLHTVVREALRIGIEGYGLTIVERMPLEIQPNARNLDYLRTKKEKLGHVLHLMS